MNGIYMNLSTKPLMQWSPLILSLLAFVYWRFGVMPDWKNQVQQQHQKIMVYYAQSLRKLAIDDDVGHDDTRGIRLQHPKLS